MAAVALGFTSCKQEEDPKYKAPTTFTVTTPALQNTPFLCASEMTDPATFNLFCNQPDYGYSAICSYSALVTLDETEAGKNGADIDESKWVILPNETPSSAQMSIKTFELSVAVNKLLGVVDAEDFANKGYAGKEFKCYFKAVCEIPSIEGSRIVSSNTTSYNKVMINYAEKKPAWIYICGDVQNEDGSQKNGFLAPSASNFEVYKANWALYEPNDKIGEKLFVGTFWLTPKKADVNPESPDDAAQFRFFTDLVGWSPDCSLGSNEADFYCKPITDKWMAGYNGDIVNQGLGNWGIHVVTPQPVTIVVDTDLYKIHVKEGVHTVSFVGRDPEFN